MSNEYSPADVYLTFAGITTLRGWTSIKVDRNTENYSQTVSADGRPSYTLSADKTGIMEVSVKQTNTEFHLAMAALQQVIDSFPEAAIAFTANLIERNGGNTTIISGVRLNKMASQDFETEEGERTYTFLIEDVKYVPTPEGLSSASRAIASATSFADTIMSALGI